MRAPSPSSLLSSPASRASESAANTPGPPGRTAASKRSAATSASSESASIGIPLRPDYPAGISGGRGQHVSPRPAENVRRRERFDFLGIVKQDYENFFHSLSFLLGRPPDRMKADGLVPIFRAVRKPVVPAVGEYREPSETARGGLIIFERVSERHHHVAAPVHKKRGKFKLRYFGRIVEHFPRYNIYGQNRLYRLRETAYYHGAAYPRVAEAISHAAALPSE